MKNKQIIKCIKWDLLPEIPRNISSSEFKKQHLCDWIPIPEEAKEDFLKYEKCFFETKNNIARHLRLKDVLLNEKKI